MDELNIIKIKNFLLGLVVHVCNPNTQQTETGWWPYVWGQPELQSNMLSPKTKNKNNNQKLQFKSFY